MYDIYLSRSLANVISARQALMAYQELRSKDLKNIAAYHVQQAIEFILKYLIYNSPKYNHGLPEQQINQLFIHDLDRLIVQYCIPYQISVPQTICKNAVTYSTWESGSRYQLNFVVRTDSIEKAINTIESWLIQLKPSYARNISRVHSKSNVSR